MPLEKGGPGEVLQSSRRPKTALNQLVSGQCLTDFFNLGFVRNYLFQTDFSDQEYFDTCYDAWYIRAVKKRCNSCVFLRLWQPLFLNMIDPKRLSVGRYLPFETPLHRIDARSKLVCSVGLITALFFAPSWSGWAIVLLTLVLISRVSGIPGRYLSGNLRSLLPILVLTLLLNALMTPGSPIVEGYAVTVEGLARGGTLCLRLMVIVTVTALLSLTTSPLDLADGLQSLLKPLTWVRVPVHEFALTGTIALRLIPLLADEAARIRRAQLSRGARTTGSLARRLKDLGAILVPLFAAAFSRAERLADAMEARGYRGAHGRTRYREGRMGWRDAVAFAVTISITTGALLLDVI